MDETLASLNAENPIGDEIADLAAAYGGAISCYRAIGTC